ncbi:DUF3667 domain-containing protein [Chryseobacterium sp. CT-SW4]|uniref:DUF3667 domain-containing protein n=1 Tax=Chryseobacterium sp. SW-1 TaxID=3157343 RepID=UPI003B01D4E1
MKKNCLNCEQSIDGNFCSNCGQKASTKRYSLQHLFKHDLVHGIWHMDKGILFTIKQLFTRPGHSIREYIQGKRVNYFNFITLIFIAIGISGLLEYYSGIKLADIISSPKEVELYNTMQNFQDKYPKWIPVLTIPIYSLFSFLWFRKAQLNYSEHLVLNSYIVAAQLIIILTFTIISVFYTDISGLFLIYSVIGFTSLIYSIWAYYQFFSGFSYKVLSLVCRTIAVPFTYFIFTLIIGMILTKFSS